MRWLFLKDLQILRRSPLLVALLVIYPIVIALLFGLALSGGPEKPKVAFANLVPQGDSQFRVGGRTLDVKDYASRLFDSIGPVPVSSREEAIAKVRSGDVLGALVIPPDATKRLRSMLGLGGGTPPTVEVYYNAEDPVKRRFVESTIEARLAEANKALSDTVLRASAGYIDVIVRGGDVSLPLVGSINILGLEKARAIIDSVAATLPQGSAELDAFAVAVAVAVSLMFVTLLLAAGLLALEREEQAFGRLVRGLVSRSRLLTEKVVLSAVCALAVTLLMLFGLAAFVGLDWSRIPAWLAALAGGALGFAAMGVAIGGLTREVRAASLLAFLLALPIVFLALVPSGSVSPALYDVVNFISGLFPFKPSLRALDSAINGGDLLLPIVHLAGLTVAFWVLARIALR